MQVVYTTSQRALKEVDGAFRVGGPATSKTAWIAPFLRHIQTPSENFPLVGVSRCDLFPPTLTPWTWRISKAQRGDVTPQNSNIMRQLFERVRAEVDAALGPQFPVFIGEWNSSVELFAWNHDEVNNAPFVAKRMTELEPLVQGSLVWNLSDIYEEAAFHYEPFHGG